MKKEKKRKNPMKRAKKARESDRKPHSRHDQVVQAAAAHLAWIQSREKFW
jgi:hypothetical protein